MAGVTGKKLPFSALKKLLSDYEIASFPLSFPSDTFGKICSGFRISGMGNTRNRRALPGRAANFNDSIDYESNEGLN